MMRKWYVYIRNRPGTVYTGISTDIKYRMIEHKAGLLYKEEYDSKEEVAKREKQIKGLNRRKKIELTKGKSLL